MLDRLRAALRGLRHRRGVALTIVVTLMLGIGANSAIFSAVDAALLKPLPYPEGERLVAVYELNLARPQATQLVAPVRLEEWSRENRSFAGLAGSYFENATDTTGEMPERVEAMRTSPRFFTVLGVPAASGRTLSPEEEIFGGPPAVVVSDAFWRAPERRSRGGGQTARRERREPHHCRRHASVVPLPDGDDGGVDSRADRRRARPRTPRALLHNRRASEGRRLDRASTGRPDGGAGSAWRRIPVDRQRLGRVADSAE